ncbi:hypothetical protein [Methanobrevibacter wolinii]|uniref:hypothetical protein n=1 Tax=Methanobrevibacter wolinii TaxID=190977 RepID=UPI000A653B86|nr:hypothetical protein [Methanobrevibacter wolinii]
MCSTGGPMADINLKKLKTRKYKCNKCGNTFKGIGKKVICPNCKSEDTECLE